MIRLLIPVNYKGEIHEPGVVHFDNEYEKKLVESGNATFDIQAIDESMKEDEQELEKVEELKEAKTSKKTTKKNVGA